MKLADHFGESSQSLHAYVFAILSGSLLGSLLHVGVEESSYVLGIIVGVALGGKINRPNLLAGLLTVLLSALILGLVIPNPWLLAAVTVLSFADELCHDRLANRTSLVGLLFRYRVGLKIGTILLAVKALISVITAVDFLCFDLSYDIASYLISKA